MSDEIKEILYLQEYIDKYKNDEKAIINGNRLTTPAMLDYIETKEILDYITNLQEELEEQKRIEQADFKIIQNLEEENERFKNDIEDISVSHFSLFKRYEDYKSRCEKAVEYIKEHIRIDDEYPAYMEMLVEEKNELLNILTGGDKE